MAVAEVTESLPPDAVEAVTRVRKAYANLAARCRDDPAAFCQYVLRDPQQPPGHTTIRLSPMHCRWHDLVTTYPRTLIMSHREAGKTVQLSVGRVLWEIGRNPQIQVAILSASQKKAADIIVSIRGYIERSPEFRRVFPEVQRGDRWTDSAFSLKRPIPSKDPTVWATGVEGAQLLGTRVDLLIVDDILTADNTRTDAQRRKIIGWFESTAVGTLTRKARVVVIGTPWHPDDLLHHLARIKAGSPGLERPVWRFERFPVMDEAGVPLWPEAWPMDRIIARRAELAGTPFEFARQMLCQARDEEDAFYKREWVEDCVAAGEGLEYVYHLNPNDLPLGASVWTGVDPSTGKHKDSGDLTAMVHLLRYATGELLLLGVEAGRWRSPDLARRLAEVKERYHGTIVVEDAGQQRMFIDLVRGQGIRVRAFDTTGKSKPLMLQAVASELANTRIIIPSQEGGKLPEHVESLLHDVLYYVPDQHTGDRLMALAIAVASSRRMSHEYETNSDVQTFRRIPQPLPGVTAQPALPPGPPSPPVDTGIDESVFDQGDD